MRRWMAGALLLLCLTASPLAGQQACSGGSGSLGCWVSWRAEDPFRNHPMAHSLGGAGMLMVARGPWFAKSFRDKRWKRLTIVVIGGSLWQAQLVKEIPGYSKKYALFDITTNLISATITDVIIEKIF